ncbi:MAG: glycerophosphodiester phosphodiesterase [Rhodospirillales bacterium]|nr:glycerophosphodiester phosphodiesterase [Rhodospirillales bacterium]
MIAVFGHRGARGLLPENTLAGFALAEHMRLTGVELDIAVTADGIPVAHHDPRLNPEIARGNSGAYVGGDAPFISALTFQQLNLYDVGRLRAGSDYAARFPEQIPRDGARIPALGELLAACPASDFLVEVKTYPDHPEATLAPKRLVEEVVRVLQGANRIGATMLCAFDWQVLEAAALLAPALRRCCLTAPETVKRPELWFGKTSLEASGGSVPRAVASTGAMAWAPFHETLGAAGMDEARRLGLTVLAWTVNEAEDIHRMIDLAVDGIISDRPDRVKTILAGRGAKMAPPGFVAGPRG